VKKIKLKPILISIILGLLCSFIPWGDNSSFHGVGFPFAYVYWDKGQNSGQFVDFPNPLAFILNPLFVYFVYKVLVVLIRVWKWSSGNMNRKKS
jgi:hypothetical protein